MKMHQAAILTEIAPDATYEVGVYEMADDLSGTGQDMTGEMAMGDADTGVPGRDGTEAAGEAADRILSEQGWSRTEDWEFGDTGMYATVERAAAD